MSWCLMIFVLLAPYVCFHIFSLGNRVATYWEIAAPSAYDMFTWYKYLIVDLVFSPPRFLDLGIFF